MAFLTAEEPAQARLTRELCTEFHGLVDDVTTALTIRQAMADLRGSVSPASLPEMAARLAGARLRALLAGRTGRRDGSGPKVMRNRDESPATRPPRAASLV